MHSSTTPQRERPCNTVHNERTHQLDLSHDTWYHPPATFKIIVDNSQLCGVINGTEKLDCDSTDLSKQCETIAEHLIEILYLKTPIPCTQS